MPVNNLNFGPNVSDWVRQTEDRMVRVFRESTQRVASLANNAVPIETGFARGSVRGSLQSMPPINPNAKGGQVNPAAFGELTLLIAGAELGETIYIGWTAAYILPLEYGHSKQAPSGFVRIAAMQWQGVVRQVSQEAQSRAAARN